MLELPGPPAGVAPEQLFRELLPRVPRRRLDYRLQLAPDTPLFVCAPTPVDENIALDRGGAAAPEIRSSAIGLELITLCLYTAEGPAFASTDEAGLLPDTEASVLVGLVAAALNHIAPSYARSDVVAWRSVLERGARHYTNLSITTALASSVDLVPAGRVHRPDRYWGCPLSELRDGHWMLYRAALRAADSMRSP